MAYFVIIGHDGPDAQQLRPIYRPEHLRRLEELQRQGRLILAGPFGDKSGSLIVLKADTQEEAQAFADGDPYTLHGVFDLVEVKPFIWVLPAPAPEM